MKRDYTVIDNREKQRFEIHVESHIAFEDYALFEGGIAYLHTEVPPELGGRGIASFLIKYLLDIPPAKALKVKPVAPRFPPSTKKPLKTRPNTCPGRV